MAPSPFLWKTVACGCPLCTLCVWWSRCPLRTKQARQCAFTGKNSAAHYCSESFPASAVSPQVEDLNAKWQRYDASRDEYVRGLHAQMQGLRAPPEPSRPSCPELMRKEISRLNRQLEEKIRVCVDVRRELVAVRGARDAALERVQMLEQQVSDRVARGPVVRVVRPREPSPCRVDVPRHQDSPVSHLLSDPRLQG